MRLEYLLLADKAEAINGKLYVFGGSWDTLTLAGTPALASYDIASSVVFSRKEAGAHDLTFELVGPEGDILLGPLGGPVEARSPEGGDIARVLAVLRGPFPQSAGGHYQWRLRVDGDVLGTVALNVVVGAVEPNHAAGAQSASINGPTQ